MYRIMGVLGAVAVLSGCAVIPEPFDELEVASIAAEVDGEVDAGQESIDGPVTLFEALSHAIRYNLDHRVEQREAALRERQLGLAHYSMLPTAVINAGFADRNNEAGGSSRRLPIGTGPITADTPSTSTERDVFSSDLKLSWNVLDFGLSYVRARQASDRILIARENRRKVVNRIVEDVRTAYWRVVTAQRLVSQLQRLEGRVESALRDTRRLSRDGDSSPLTALTFERELVEIKREIHRLSGDLSVANLQLAALMNVRPGRSFRVVVPHRMPQPPYIGLGPDDMVAGALERRPEIREVAYEQRINRAEARVAMLELLPSLGANIGPNWNSNALLFNQNYVAWGAQASWNLLKVFAYPAREAEILSRDELLRTRSLAVTMAVMTQVHVARARLVHARRRYRTAQHFTGVQQRILDQIRSALNAGKVSEQTAIREEMNTLVARVKLDLVYVELQNAYGAAYAAMGINPFAQVDVEYGTVDDLALSLRDGWHGLRPTPLRVADISGDAEPATQPGSTEAGQFVTQTDTNATGPRAAFSGAGQAQLQSAAFDAAEFR